MTQQDSACGNLNSTHPVVPCCANGDLCLTDGMCSYQKSLDGGSSYYVAGCTASSGLCPSFSDRCTSTGVPDATWNSTSELWQCCGMKSNNNPSCENPTNEQFRAPSPALLQTIFSVSQDGWTATSTTILSTTTSLASAASTTSTSAANSSTAASTPISISGSPSPQNGLSSGEKVGIGVGAASATLAILGLLAYLVYRKRGRRWRSGQRAAPPASSHEAGMDEMQEERFKDSAAIHELSGSQRPVEMSNRNAMHELSAQH